MLRYMNKKNIFCKLVILFFGLSRMKYDLIYWFNTKIKSKYSNIKNTLIYFATDTK